MISQPRVPRQEIDKRWTRIDNVIELDHVFLDPRQKVSDFGKNTRKSLALSVAPRNHTCDVEKAFIVAAHQRATRVSHAGRDGLGAESDHSRLDQVSPGCLQCGVANGPPESPMQAETVLVPNPIIPGWIRSPQAAFNAASPTGHQSLPCRQRRSWCRIRSFQVGSGLPKLPSMRRRLTSDRELSGVEREEELLR